MNRDKREDGSVVWTLGDRVYSARKTEEKISHGVSVWNWKLTMPDGCLATARFKDFDAVESFVAQSEMS